MWLKKKGRLVLGAVLVLLLATACGSDEEPTTAPATEAPTETVEATEEPEATEAVETEKPEETKEPEEKDEGIDESFDATSFVKLFDNCIGIEGTAGESLKYATAAEKCLGYAVSYQLSKINSASVDSLKTAMQDAYNFFTGAKKKEFKNNMREEIMPIITDSFEDASSHKADLEDAGVYTEWQTFITNKSAKDDWSVFWEAFESISDE